MTKRARRVPLTDDDYPARLRDLRDAPDPVWIRGRIPRGPCVAVVGTRRASPEAIGFTERMARDLARGGATVVSGGADGIDAAAHRGAVLGGGRTVVVQAAGLDAPYPRSNAGLFAKILETGGAWVSETPPSQRPEKWRFLARNRLIAALADVVVVVQAPARSGALSTARAAQALGRPLLAVPGAPWDPRAEGVLELLAQGARVCRGSADVAKLAGVPQVTLALGGASPPKAALPDEQARVLAALADGPRHVDELVSALGLGAAQVQVALVELSMVGLVRQDAGRWRAS